LSREMKGNLYGLNRGEAKCRKLAAAFSISQTVVTDFRVTFKDLFVFDEDPFS